MKTDAGRAEQDAEIFRLRCRGHSLRTIAAEVGLSHQTVANRIQDAIRELVNPAAELWRGEETARLNDLARSAYEVLDNAESGDVALKAIDRVLRISESRRKLWALDAPTPIDIALSRRDDVESELVVDALKAVVESLGLDEEGRLAALRAAQWALGGREGPMPQAPAAAPVVGERQSDLMADFRRFAEQEGFDPDEEDDDDER